MQTELTGKLQKLGFTENEAKIYIGLLRQGEATARRSMNSLTFRERRFILL